MKIYLFAFLAIMLNPIVAVAQRDPPVWNSFLPRIAMFDERTKLDFEITFKKGGGPVKQSPHAQIYVLGYLEKDESKILKLAADKKLTTKSKHRPSADLTAGKKRTTEPEDKLLLDLLVAEKLVTLLGNKIAKKSEVPVVISLKSDRAVAANCYDFEFSFDNSKLFESIGKLKNFDHTNFVESDHKYYNDKFKLMIFVPVNDCKYATKIPKEQRELHDFAHFADRETILQYFKPLPYRFQFKPLDEEGVVLLYID